MIARNSEIFIWTINIILNIKRFLRFIESVKHNIVLSDIILKNIFLKLITKILWI